MAVIRDNWVFVHVPKCAGVSIKAALGERHEPVPHLPRKVLPLDRPAWGVLRNPFERMVSLYYFLWQSPRRHLPRVDPVAVREMGFKRWLLEGSNYTANEPQPDGQVWTWESRRYGADVTYPGLEVIAAETDLAPQQRRPVMWYLEGCDYVVRFENLADDFRRVMHILGERRPPTLPHANQTLHKPQQWRAEYDAETIDHVRRYFARDIEAGGYEVPEWQ